MFYGWMWHGVGYGGQETKAFIARIFQHLRQCRCQKGGWQGARDTGERELRAVYGGAWQGRRRLLATAICLACQSAPCRHSVPRSANPLSARIQHMENYQGARSQWHISSVPPSQMQRQSVAPLKRVCVALHHQRRQQKQICIVSCISIRDGNRIKCLSDIFAKIITWGITSILAHIKLIPNESDCMILYII